MSDKKASPLTRVNQAGIRLFFRLLYHSFAWMYDGVAATVSVGRWQRWVLAAAGQATGPRVLELGFGPGHLQAELCRRGIAAWGLDESWQMATQASSRLRKLGHSPRLARGLAQTLPFPTEQFDQVVATFPTLYILDPHTLAEIQRVLRPGGRLVVLMAAWITGRSLLDRLMAQVFRVTGEAPDENLEIAKVIEPYQTAGFQASARFVKQPGSRLMFIIASKNSNPTRPGG